ncbi:MAG TPA: hypothetical protein VMW38_12815 [Terriglobia bacterium]|nr:hypothetical protein [Terriglobia bacterium]
MSLSMEGSNYMGDDGRGDCFFSLKSWLDFQQQLVPAEVIMRIAAVKWKMKFLSNIRGSWPARRLRKRRGLYTEEIRWMLNPNYLIDKELFYQLRKQKTREIWGFFRKDVRDEEIKRYSVEEMMDHELLARDLELAIQPPGGGHIGT